MTVHEDLTTQYHQQDTGYYCGAACAQMVLAQCGAGVLDQVGLYNDNHNHSVIEGGWYTAPDGLAWTMNNRQSAGKYFCLDAMDSEDAVSRMIAWTIHDWRISPIAMVFGSAHWIVVRGYTASDYPSYSADTSYTISGFDINNPEPPTPAGGPPPPHSAGDVCGSGGSRGVADEHVSYSTWQADYMTGISGGHWDGKFVAICDPAPPTPMQPASQEPRRPRFDGDVLLEPRRVAELSRQSLEEVGLTERENWRIALEGTEVGEPVLVQRLDRADSFYWIVPHTRGGLATVAVSIDARFGDYKQARALPNPQGTALLTLDQDDVRGFVYDRLHDLPDAQGQLRIRPGLACISDHWVWRPCMESLSPFYPFKVVNYGAYRLYVRSDGAVFHSLTDPGRGV